MKLTWDKDSTAYDAAEKIIFDKYPDPCDHFVVQLRTRYDPVYEWNTITTILLNDGSYSDPDFVWDYDWWEGEPEVELIAFAPVEKIELGDEWKV